MPVGGGSLAGLYLYFSLHGRSTEIISLTGLWLTGVCMYVRVCVFVHVRVFVRVRVRAWMVWPLQVGPFTDRVPKTTRSLLAGSLCCRRCEMRATYSLKAK